MIKVILKDDDGRVIQAMEYPVGAIAMHQEKDEKTKDSMPVTIAGLFGKLITNLIVNNVKDKYFGGLL